MPTSFPFDSRKDDTPLKAQAAGAPIGAPRGILAIVGVRALA